ncbi:hypothetical protein [Rickettsiella endosymbiont of Dermanyssus gallinae]|uniref:hypothetical protein n=1 Tax=Rickettsiella endosymbiont of Dermanyssus gallinae TaxID=2856608 RepID=UPI001C529535|nr:hypothetical protein [Rickettsiella endosymbiont of Dermanyssus gallinae]
MNTKIRLNELVRRLASSNVPDKKALLRGYESFKALVQGALFPDLLRQAIGALQANPFCRQFKLDTDPCFLKILDNKIKDAEQAEMAMLSLLSRLEDYLIKELEFEKKENPSQKDSAFELFIEELEELTSIFSYKMVTSKHIAWFLNSDLFYFMSDRESGFTEEVKDIYKALLKNTKTGKKEYFMEHKQVLIEKANTAMRNKEVFDRRAFFLILNARRNDFKVKLNASNYSNKPILLKAKARKPVTFSPIAKQAIFNHLRRSKLFINKQAAMPTKNVGRCVPGGCSHSAPRS